jgi:hypothetical protein
MTTWLPILAFAAWAIVFGAFGAFVARRRGRRPLPWVVYGVILGPVAGLLVSAAPPRTCPTCRARTLGWASICPSCGRDTRRSTPMPWPALTSDDAVDGAASGMLQAAFRHEGALLRQEMLAATEGASEPEPSAARKADLLRDRATRRRQPAVDGQLLASAAATDAGPGEAPAPTRARVARPSLSLPEASQPEPLRPEPLRPEPLRPEPHRPEPAAAPGAVERSSAASDPADLNRVEPTAPEPRPHRATSRLASRLGATATGLGTPDEGPIATASSLAAGAGAPADAGATPGERAARDELAAPDQLAAPYERAASEAPVGEGRPDSLADTGAADPESLDGTDSLDDDPGAGLTLERLAYLEPRSTRAGRRGGMAPREAASDVRDVAEPVASLLETKPTDDAMAAFRAQLIALEPLAADEDVASADDGAPAAIVDVRAVEPKPLARARWATSRGGGWAAPAAGAPSEPGPDPISAAAPEPELVPSEPDAPTELAARRRAAADSKTEVPAAAPGLPTVEPAAASEFVAVAEPVATPEPVSAAAPPVSRRFPKAPTGSGTEPAAPTRRPRRAAGVVASAAEAAEAPIELAAPAAPSLGADADADDVADVPTGIAADGFAPALVVPVERPRRQRSAAARSAATPSASTRRTASAAGGRGRPESAPQKPIPETAPVAPPDEPTVVEAEAAASTHEVLATGAYLGGTERLVAGSRYAVTLRGGSLEVCGPMSETPDQVVAARDLDAVEIVDIGGRLVITGQGTGKRNFIIVLDALIGADAESLERRFTPTGTDQAEAPA